LDLFDLAGKLQVEVGDILSTAVYDIAPNGDGFVGAQQPGSALTGDAGASARPELRVVLNWFEELKKLVPTQ
jgi:hypothetical protein